MRVRFAGVAVVLALAGPMMAQGASAEALSMKECSTKYAAAKAGDTLKGRTWNEFRKQECSADSAASSKAAEPEKSARRSAPAAGGQGSGHVVFPRAVDSKYAAEKAHVQRQKTCSDQWRANKAGGGNGDLRWIQKGGGYWSQCNAKLKGQTGA